MDEWQKKDIGDVVKLLMEYTQYLYTHGYINDDWWAGAPSPIQEFINKKLGKRWGYNGTTGTGI